MTLDEITSKAAALLQDTSNVRWTLAELRSYVEDAQKEWLRLTEFPRTTGTAQVVLNNTTVAVPTDISVVKVVRLQGLQLQIVTSSQLDQKYMGQHPTLGVGSWLASTGTPLYLVKDARNARTLRIVPYPTKQSHLSNLSTASNAYTAPDELTSALIFVVNSVSDTATTTAGSDVIYAADYTKYFVGAVVRNDAVLQDNSKVTQISTVLVNNPSNTAQHGRYAITLDKTADGTSTTGVSVAVISTNSLIENTSTVDGYIWTIEGVASGEFTFRDTTNTANYLGTASSLLPDMYNEALVYGCLERAFLKENELRNLEKSQLWRAKFYEIVVDCQRREGQNDLSHIEGVDRMTMTIPFPMRYGGRRMYGPSWSPTSLTTGS